MFTNEFISICKDFAQKRNYILSEELEDTKKICKYKIEFYSFILEFRYVKKESAFFKSSSLYCVVYFRKNSVVYYHLTDIIPFLDHRTFKSCYFWNIESPERLNCCFESLMTILDSITSQIQSFLIDDSLLLKNLFNSYKMIYNLKENDIDFNKIEDDKDYNHSYFLYLQNMRDGYIFSRYCNFAPYALLLKNKVDKALKKYEKLNKKDKLFEYEKHLIDHIRNSEPCEFHAFDSTCDTSISEKLMAPLSGLKAFAAVFCISSIFFCGFSATYNLIVSINALLVLSAPWYTGFICAGLCSVFGAIAFISYMPNRHLTKKERKAFSNILISKGVKKFSFVTFVLSVLVSMFFAVMIMFSNVRFYDYGVKFDKQSYDYNQIDSVYHIDARYNVYGDRIERASYVILFNDKTSLDLDGYTSVEFTKKEVLPLLESKGFDVKNADSERELPWYSE